jgi:hypothetical protein
MQDTPEHTALTAAGAAAPPVLSLRGLRKDRLFLRLRRPGEMISPGPPHRGWCENLCVL